MTAFIATDCAEARDAGSVLVRDFGLHRVDMRSLRNARIIEPLGDVIRYLILGAGLDPCATLKVNVPAPVHATRSGRFGDRAAATWWTPIFQQH